MKQILNLSERLKTVATFLPKGAFFVDVGSDHAYLPCYVCMNDPNSRAIAGEVNQGPYESAVETVGTYDLSSQINVRLGDGLKILANDRIKQVTIAGMGGSLITKILTEGTQKLNHVERIIVQPNVGERNVRQWFLTNGFRITCETIIEENDHIYEIIVADRNTENTAFEEPLNEKELLFGPILLQHKSPVFYKKWQIQKQKRQQVIDQMKQATTKNYQKIHQLEKEVEWIMEVIADE